MTLTSSPLDASRARARPFLIIAVTLTLAAIGLGVLVTKGRKDQVDYPLAKGGHFTVKRDSDGRVSQIRIFHPDGKPRLRTTIAYDSAKGAINEVMILDGTDELVEGHLMQNGGHSIGPQPPIENPPFKLSFAAEGPVREWKCDGQSLLREERTTNGFKVSGPEGVDLSAPAVAR
jgi:hypothetical protein